MALLLWYILGHICDSFVQEPHIATEFLLEAFLFLLDMLEFIIFSPLCFYSLCC